MEFIHILVHSRSESSRLVAAREFRTAWRTSVLARESSRKSLSSRANHRLSYDRTDLII